MKFKNFNKILTGGCSFTAGSSNYNTAITNPSTWLHFLIAELKNKIFANLAIAGSSNLATSVNLISFLEKFKYFNNKETLILFNITGLDRIDTLCPVDHPDSNDSFSYDKILNYGWITEGGFLGKIPPFNGLLQKNIGYEQIKILNEYAIISLISYLENYKYEYRFMYMDHKILDASSEGFKNFLNQRSDNFITFDTEQTMHGFCKTQSLLDIDQFHPNLEGHQLISKKILENLVNTNLVH